MNTDKEQDLIEKYYDYIKEYSASTDQSEIKHFALPRLPKHQPEYLLGNKGTDGIKKKKSIFQMNTSKLMKGFMYWLGSYMIINLGIMCLWLMTAALFDLQSPKFNDTELLIFQWGQIVIGLISVLWAQEELERRGE